MTLSCKCRERHKNPMAAESRLGMCFGRQSELKSGKRSRRKEVRLDPENLLLLRPEQTEVVRRCWQQRRDLIPVYQRLASHPARDSGRRRAGSRNYDENASLNGPGEILQTFGKIWRNEG